MAEDPVFRYVLNRAQERVDEAYRKDGAKRGGKNSPWEIYKDAINRATAKHQSAQDDFGACQKLRSSARLE
jgi:hypothetical protein